MRDPCQSKVIRDDENGEDQFIDGKSSARDDEKSDDEFIDEKAAAKTLALYCKPVELYNTLRDRFKNQPVFLQRCLNYRIHALQQKRLKVALQVQGLVNMSPFLQWNSCKDYINFGSSTTTSHPFLPIFVMVTDQPSSPQGVFSLSKVYKVARMPLRDVGALSSQVTFLLPPLAKLLVHAKNRHFIFLFSFVDPRDVFDIAKQQTRDLASCSGNVLWSKLSITTLCTQWLWNANWNRSPSRFHSPCFHAVCTLDFWPGKLQHVDKALRLIIQVRPLLGEAPTSLRRSEMRLQGHISAEEIGLNILNESILNETSEELSSSQPSRNCRGRVEFHFLYYFNRCEKIEVMERYSCPFCLTQCHTFKVMFGAQEVARLCHIYNLLLSGKPKSETCEDCLQCHLSCTHDLFNFEYLLNADAPVVNVTCRTELLDPEGEILQESKPDLKTKLWIFGSHRPRKKTLVSQCEETHEKNCFTSPPVTVLEKLYCCQKRAVKGVEKKGGAAHRTAKGQLPGKRRKVGATFHEEIQPHETNETPLEVASYLRSGLMRIRPKGC